MNDNFDDRVIVVAMLVGLVVGVGLILMRVIGAFPIPAQFMMLFLSITVCGLTYRFLGGVDGAKLQTSLLTIGGTGALYIGLLLLVGKTVDDQFTSLEQKPLQKQNSALKADLEKANEKMKDLSSTGTAQVELTEESVMKFIKSRQPSSEIIGDVIKMVKQRRHPFKDSIAEHAVKISAIPSPGGDSRGYFICQDSFDKLFPNDEGANGTLSLSRMVNEGGEMKNAIVRYKGLIQTTACTNTLRKFDIQISCEIATELFPGATSGCNGTDAILGAQVIAESLRE